MNYLIVGDLHLKLNNLEAADLFFDYLFEEIKKKGKDVEVFFLGDIYEVKSIIRVEVQNYFYNKLSKISDNVKAIYLILGNHDYTNKNLVDHAFNFGCEKLIKNLKVIDKPSILNDGIWAIPYCENSQDFIKRLADLTSTVEIKKPKIIFCHQAFNGFAYSVRSGVKEENGVDLEKVKFDGCKVIAGHFHSFQEKDVIVYLGTPFAHTFSEANESKKILWIKDDKWEYLSTGDKVPRYCIFDTNFNELLGGKKFGYKENDHVKFLISDKEENCKKVTKDFLGSLMDEGKIKKCDNVYLQYSFSDHQVDINIDENQSVISMFEDYVNIYLKDNKYKGLILKVGVGRYLKNASL